MPAAKRLTPVQARQQFANWVRRYQPKLYAAILKKIKKPGVHGLGDASTSTSSPSFMDAFDQLATTYISGQTQVQVAKTQAAAAQASQPPHPVDAMGLPASGFMAYLPWIAGLGILGLGAVTLLRRRGRR